MSSENAGDFDIGVYGTIQKTMGGWGTSARITLGASQTIGNRNNFDGQDSSVSVGVGPIGCSVSTGDSDTYLDNGISIDVGLNIGAQGTADYTGSITAGDAGRCLARFLSGSNEPCIGDPSIK